MKRGLRLKFEDFVSVNSFIDWIINIINLAFFSAVQIAVDFPTNMVAFGW